MALPEPFAGNPELIAILAVVMRLALAYQRGLTWPEYRTLHAAKRVVFPILDRWEPSGFTSFVNDKGGRRDAEYLRTVEVPYREVVTWLRSGGGTLHLISSVKRRPPDYGDPLSIAHVVWTHADSTQTEAYLFRNDDTTTDVYAHHETSVADPEGHLSDPQTDADPRGVVTQALDERQGVESVPAELGDERAFKQALRQATGDTAREDVEEAVRDGEYVDVNA